MLEIRTGNKGLCESPPVPGLCIVWDQHVPDDRWVISQNGRILGIEPIELGMGKRMRALLARFDAQHSATIGVSTGQLLLWTE